jgi:hypothetical protein
MGLGPVSVKPDDKRITLADARQKAAAARSLLIDGIDPIAARDARRAQTALADGQAVTFKPCADEYLRDNEGGVSCNHRACASGLSRPTLLDTFITVCSFAAPNIRSTAD